MDVDNANITIAIYINYMFILINIIMYIITFRSYSYITSTFITIKNKCHLIKLFTSITSHILDSLQRHCKLNFHKKILTKI